MMSRRDWLGASGLGGLFGGIEPAQSAAAQSEAIERGMRDMAQAVEELRKMLDAQHSFSEIAGIRQRQTEHLRTSGKLPDAMEVGSQVWWNVYDWHIRHQQPATIGRDAGGRYTIVLVQTTLILRPEMAPGFIGQPYDNR
jgi:hypothetical protein